MRKERGGKEMEKRGREEKSRKEKERKKKEGKGEKRGQVIAENKDKGTKNKWE